MCGQNRTDLDRKTSGRKNKPICDEQCSVLMSMKSLLSCVGSWFHVPTYRTATCDGKSRPF